jgi:hypothetical protein
MDELDFKVGDAVFYIEIYSKSLRMGIVEKIAAVKIKVDGRYRFESQICHASIAYQKEFGSRIKNFEDKNPGIKVSFK